jgi:hypothetical protein
MRQLCDICNRESDKTILYRIACNLLNTEENNSTSFFSQSPEVQRQRREIFNIFFPTPVNDFFLNALACVGKPKNFSEPNKELITDTCNSLLNANRLSKSVCFACFIKEILKISRKATSWHGFEQWDTENRLSNLERTVYERGESSSRSQGNSNIENRLYNLENVVQQQGESSRSQIRAIARNLNNTDVNMALLYEDVQKKTNIPHVKEELNELDKKTNIQNLKKKKKKLLNPQKWRRALKKHEKKWIKEIKDLEEAEKVEKKLEEVTKWNIYDFDGVEHLLGWPAFLVLVGSVFYWVRKESKKEVSSENFLEDIKDKFVKWRLNLYCSVAVYIVLFFLSQQAINKWGYLVSISAAKSEFWTVLGIAILLGGLYIGDNFITSILKTPLQRLGVKIENSPIQEKIKKKLLSKTQEANESFKETFKKFGIVAITPLLISLVRKKVWDANLIANVCFLVPIAYAIVRIIEISRILKKVDKSKRKLL